MECSCCENKAKYEIASDFYCGKHIGIGLGFHLGMSEEVQVRLAQKENKQ